MRIAIAKTEAAGGGVDHYSTDPEFQGAHMKGYNETDTGLQILLGPGSESRVYPWTSIAFVDHFMTPAR